jgi:peroxiredoxin Q/BCP
LRRDYKEFTKRQAEVVVVNPADAEAVRAYWEREELPFVGLADPRHDAARLYGQRVSLLRLGRMPALAVVDREGRLRYRHFADNMADIPPNAELLAVLDALAGEDTLEATQKAKNSPE